MSMYGKVSAWLTALGLIGTFILLSMAGKRHNDVSAEISKSQESAEKAKVEAHSQELELIRISNDLTRAQLGWDKSWNIKNDGNTGVLVQNDGRLVVAGIGRENGLVPVEYTNEAGESATSPPAVHAFKNMEDGSVRYIGEFFADMPQGQIGPSAVTLIPNWQWTEDELQLWASNPQGGWRFRTLIPAASRSRIDQLNDQIVRLRELYLEIHGNVAQQENLLSSAESQLSTRQGELLGSQDVEPIPGRPELSDGLLKTIKSEEDRRNTLQTDVDQLRRDIKKASDARDRIIEQLEDLLQQLPDADSDSYLSRGSDPATN